MAVAAMTIGSAAMAQNTFALVPKNMNNPFFDQARDGCMKAAEESGGKFVCEYIGPGEHGGGDEQMQIVQDLVARGDLAGIAVSPSNAAAMAVALQAAKDAGIPVLTWDSDLLPENQDLRVAYIGTHNYEIGTNLAKLAMEIKPEGGTVCIQSGGAAAANHNERMQGIRDTLGGMSGTESPGVRLTGENGWTEADGCPLYTDDDFPRSVQQFEDFMIANPDLGRVHSDGRLPAVHPGRQPRGGRAVQGQDRRRRARPRGRRHAADPDRPDEGRLFRRPGRPASLRDGLSQHAGPPADGRGRRAADGPDLYGPRRLHAGDGRHLHRAVI